MSFYRMGLVSETQARPLIRIGGREKPIQLIKVGGSGILGTGTFADLKEEISQLRTEMDTDEHEMFDQVDPTKPTDPKTFYYKGIWRPFYDGYRDFADNHSQKLARVVEAINPFFGRATFNDVQDFRTRFVLIHDGAKKAGFKFKGPDPTPPKASDFSVLGKVVDEIWGVVKWVLIIGAIVAGVGVLIYLVRR